MPIAATVLSLNALHAQLPDRAAPYAARLAAIRAEISFLHAAPYAYGRLNGPHRRRRDELILQGFAADLNARMVEARAA